MNIFLILAAICGVAGFIPGFSGLFLLALILLVIAFWPYIATMFMSILGCVVCCGVIGVVIWIIDTLFMNDFIAGLMIKLIKTFYVWSPEDYNIIAFLMVAIVAGGILGFILGIKNIRENYLAV